VRAAYPGQRLALVAPRWLTPLVDLVGGVDVVPDPACCPRPALAVNLHGRGPQSHRRLAAARPRRLLAFANAAAGHPDGPAWRADEHEVDRWCRLLSWYGVPTDPADLDLAVPAVEAPAGLTVVHPGAKSPVRRWPRFAQVARRLSADGHDVVVTGSAAERGLAESVARDAGLRQGAVLAGRTGLAELAALVAGARLVVSGDTGVAHLATAYRTPSVVLCGPVPPRLWGPPADRPWHRAIWLGNAVDRGDDPGPDPHPALLAITPDAVLAAAAAVQAARRPGAAVRR
jgi:ADP-heptose:LPS heptosyltransferase